MAVNILGLLLSLVLLTIVAVLVLWVLAELGVPANILRLIRIAFVVIGVIYVVGALTTPAHFPVFVIR